MSAQLQTQLREAVVVLSSAQEAVFVGTIEKLAEANPTTTNQLERLRLSFGLESPSEDVGRFDEQLAAAGVRLGARDVQLRRTLAACVLVARFGRVPGRRGYSTLVPDTAAAIGVRILMRARRRPVHPDVSDWAEYWVDSLAMHLRKPRRLPSPPRFSPELAAPDPELPYNEAAAQVAGEMQERFAAFTNELLTWSSELDPAEVKAQGEQIDLLWWLQGGAVTEKKAEAVVSAASGLRKHTRWIPGPPQSSLLLRRRLGTTAVEEVSLEDVATHVARHVPAAAQDLCPLLTRDKTVLAGRSLECAPAAAWLFDELTLVDLIEMKR